MSQVCQSTRLIFDASDNSFILDASDNSHIRGKNSSTTRLTIMVLYDNRAIYVKYVVLRSSNCTFSTTRT